MVIDTKWLTPENSQLSPLKNMSYQSLIFCLLSINFWNLVTGPGIAWTQDPSTTTELNSTTETWLGTLDVKVAKLRLQLDLKTGADGATTGDMISLDQATTPIPMDRMVRTDKQLEFQIDKLGVKYVGAIDASGKLAKGKFTQGDTYDLDFKIVEAVPTIKHELTWVGTLVAGPQSFDFQFRVFVDSEGNHSVKLDSFSEGLMGLPCEMKQDGKAVKLTIKISNAEFVGTLSDDQQTIDGHWLQSGNKFPFQLKQIPLTETRTAKLNRPQTPQPPFPYEVSDFSVTATDIDAKYAADVVLAGTMTRPKTGGPFPTVILITGSGQQDRDETIFEHKPFAVIADHLTRQGFAVIRFDDRGQGKSTGTVLTATSVDFADDVEVVFRWAQRQRQLDAKKIILAGHSEGGLIAPLIAIRQPELAGMILLAGPGVAGDEIILNQSRRIAAAAGAPAQLLELQDTFLRRIISKLDATEPLTGPLVQQLADEVFEALPDEQKKSFNLDNIVSGTMAMNSPWMKFFLKHDPRPALTQATCPILSLIGEHDLQVDPALNLPAIEAAVQAGSNADFVQKQLPGLNHLFQTSDTGLPSDYIKIEETVSPILLDEITVWLKQRFQQ